jgi:hypothetical protein
VLRDGCELVWIHCRDSFGQCGHGDRTEKIVPTLLNVFGKRRIVHALPQPALQPRTILKSSDRYE